MENDVDKMMTLTEFATRYFTEGSIPSTATLESWVKSGKLKTVKLGRRRFVSVKEAELFVRGGEREEVRRLARKEAQTYERRQRVARMKLEAFGVQF